MGKENKELHTSESVTVGHPDKVADSISDAILTEYLSVDENARVAVEALVTTNHVTIAGEVKANEHIDVERVVRDTIIEIGYDKDEYQFNGHTATIDIHLDEQSSDISQAVDKSDEHIGAGDQGLMFGYAVRETPELMPLPIMLAHWLAMRLEEVRKKGIVDHLGPDGKTQVTVEYENDQPVRIDTMLISTQHTDSVQPHEIERDMCNQVIRPVLMKHNLTHLVDDDTLWLINPSGRFVIGGPHGDVGLTGRKIIVDSYGSAARIGGGAYSGKDYTKVDRSGAYVSRYIAKNIVAAGLADRCEVQLAYAIGVAHPVSVNIETFGTEIISKDLIMDAVLHVFDLEPIGIRDMLDLKNVPYNETSAYGHFGQENCGLTWEKTDKAHEIVKHLYS